MQEEIDDPVRRNVGRMLDQTMGPQDSVVLEPLGYMGYEAFNKTTYDFPGMSSKRVTDVIKSMRPVRMGGLVQELRPSHVVLRPRELEEFEKYYPRAASNYEPIAHVRAQPRPVLFRWGYRVYPTDLEFWIFQRVDPPPELGHRPRIGR